MVPVESARQTLFAASDHSLDSPNLGRDITLIVLAASDVGTE